MQQVSFCKLVEGCDCGGLRCGVEFLRREDAGVWGRDVFGCTLTRALAVTAGLPSKLLHVKTTLIVWPHLFVQAQHLHNPPHSSTIASAAAAPSRRQSCYI